MKTTAENRSALGDRTKREIMSRDKASSSYSAFASVDAAAAKPIMGSDGAASWQEFRKDKKISTISKGTAPHAPLKKADKLGTGFKSIDEERRHEEKVRREGNDAAMNSGYTTFKRKHDKGEMEERKRRKLIEERIKPDKVKYYFPAATFEGWKEDYIFTTRERGTGYYWDGMDSLKKLRGESVGPSNALNNNVQVDPGELYSEITNAETKSKKKKSKKSKKEKRDAAQSSHHVIEDDVNNPMEQILNAMRRKTEILNLPPGSNSQILHETEAALTGTISSTSKLQNLESTNDDEKLVAELAIYDWEVATDPNSGKRYYYSRKTGETQWNNPIDRLKNSSTNASSDDKLPEGWRLAEDSVGRTYYYHRESGKTSWERPTVSNP